MLKRMIASLVFVVLTTQTYAETPQEKGLRIALEAKARNVGWKNSEASMEMHLFDTRGNSNVRKLRMKTVEVLDDGDKSLSIFDQPKNIRGTRFLNASHALEADDQWIYMPTLKRVKRISSKNKSGPFLGSEFAYEDLGSFEVEKYSYRYLSEEVLNGAPCHYIEFVPKYEDSGYTKMKVWIDAVTLQQQKVDFYDRKETLLKTLNFRDYKLYKDKYWHAHTKEVVNHQNNQKTILYTLDYQLDVELDPSELSVNGLKRKF